MLKHVLICGHVDDRHCHPLEAQFLKILISCKYLEYSGSISFNVCRSCGLGCALRIG